MAPSGRGRRSGTTTASGSFPTPIPPYQRPANPLTPGAQRAFNELPRTHRLEGLKKHLHQATHSLTTVAGDVNDRYYKKLEAHRKHKARRQGKNEDDDDDAGDQTLEEMRVMVDQMTRSLEESVRKMIDGKAAVDGIEAALREISTNISSGGGVVVPTQSTLGASQFRPSKRQRDPDSDGEDSDSQEDSNQTHPLGLVKRKMTEYNSNYQNLSMRHKFVASARGSSARSLTYSFPDTLLIMTTSASRKSFTTPATLKMTHVPCHMHPLGFLTLPPRTARLTVSPRPTMTTTSSKSRRSGSASTAR